tara:strand:+ start:3409 stop:5949 length:2541 start_codon:yes stop_codon:yes gene_type:complete
VSDFSTNLNLSMASVLESKSISEVIIVDNCSDENNSNQIKNISRINSKVKYYKNSTNLGKHLSLIKALEKSNTGYVMMLDPDEFIIPNAIDKLFDFIQINNLDLAYGKMAIQKENEIFRFQHPGYRDSSYIDNRNELNDLFFYDNYIPRFGTIIKKSSIFPYFNTDYHKNLINEFGTVFSSFDYDLFINLAKKNKKFGFLDEFVCVDCEKSKDQFVRVEEESLKYLEKIFLFNKHFKNESPDKLMIFSIENNLDEKLNLKKKSNTDSENKNLLKHFYNFQKIKKKENGLRSELKKNKLMDTIVGFQSGHDVSYCLLKNGKPLIHEELERFTRVKEELGDGLKMFFDAKHHLHHKNIKYFTFGNFGGRQKKWGNNTSDTLSNSKMNKLLNKNKGQFIELSHHMTHAANAFFSSNFENSLILTIDGGGSESEKTTTCATIYEGKNNAIKKVNVFNAGELNLASGWNLITKLFELSIGFPKGNQAGTVMAMASMSDSEKYVEPLVELMTNTGLQKEYFQLGIESIKLSDLKKNKLVAKIFGTQKFSEQDKFDIASSLQKASEFIVKETLEKFLGQHINLCVAGGCALNSVIIGKIQDWFNQIENIYVPPVPYDSGLAIGSAQFLWHQILGNKRIKWKDNFTPYLGRKYNEEDIKKTLNKFKDFITFNKVDDEKIIKNLDNQKIVSVFGGGSESGRRALGNRSIIADPRNEKMKEIINEKVKHRQWFRPFAPSILKEETGNWFEKNVSSPYMTHVIKWKKDKKNLVPAVVHFDGSARLQTVTENDNSWYYNLIKKWEKKTGIPVVLNTSFNDSEPIVESPEDAIRCFLKTNIDNLYFFDCQILVSKLLTD